MLKNKLFILTISIITLTLILSGIVYYKNINSIFNEQSQLSINHDLKMVNTYIDATKDNIKTLTEELANSESFKSSLHLLSKYKSEENYSKEKFDIENENLLFIIQHWFNQKNNLSINLYDKDKKLILINDKNKNSSSLGYISYDENNNLYFVNKIDETNKNIPKHNVLDNSYINKLESKIENNTYVLLYFKPIRLNGEIIAYIKVCYTIDNTVLDSIKHTLVNDYVLQTTNNQYIFPSNINIKKLKEITKSNNHTIKKTRILDNTNPLYLVTIINKSEQNKRLQNALNTMIFIWILILGVTFLFSYLFLDKYILNPIKKLQNTIKTITNNHHLQNTNTDQKRKKDEIRQIANEFSNLSKTFDKNNAFLESYKNVIDEGSIVSKSDLNGRITYANENFVKISGYSKKETIGAPHSLVRHSDTKDSTFKEMWETIKNKKVWKGILKNKKKDGTHYWVDMVIRPILDGHNEITEYIAVRHDITELMDQRETLKKITNTDKLTNLPSRFKLINDITNIKTPALSFLNIDNFRQVNDFYGHYFGDLLIKKISQALLGLNKNEKNITVYRTQADEFAILAKLSSTYEKEDFYNKILQIIKSINHKHIEIQREELSINLTASISYEKKSIILSTANMALKHAKKQNIDIAIYKEEFSLDKLYENNIKWAMKLKSAIKEDRIVPFFQPIVNNTTGKYEKYESLVRLIDDDAKVITPYFFLEIAKQTKHYTALTKIMIKKSFEMFRDKDIDFSINLTVDDILNDDIQKYIFTMLQNYKVCNRVVFEIVESESIENFSAVSKFIEHVKERKCKIAIDDFGTGYSNFEYLMKLKADYIKIDGSMIKNIHNDENAKMVVSTIVDFAKKMNMKTIAEFVENEEIQKVVKELGIDYSQGYLFSAPKEYLD